MTEAPQLIDLDSIPAAIFVCKKCVYRKLFIKKYGKRALTFTELKSIRCNDLNSSTK